MKKTFNTQDALSITTGRMLSNDFMDFYPIFEHLFPGIGPFSCSLMREHAAKYIEFQHPGIKELGECNEENFGKYLIMATKKLGPTLDIDGPCRVMTPEGESANATQG